MKTKIEQHIKSQLQDRNLNPSPDAWERLSQMMGDERPQQKTTRFPKWLTLAVAASVVVCISIFLVNFEEKTDDTIHITSSKNASEVQIKDNEIIPEEIKAIETIEKVYNPETQLVRSDSKSNMKIESSPNSEIITQEKITENNLIKQELKLPEIQAQEEIVLSPEPKTESGTKKKKYVDSDMLLYSVENNQAISESNDNTRFVVVDFNK